MEQCEQKLKKKLFKLKDEGKLFQSLLPFVDGAQNKEFEVLEFYGDSVLYERVSNLLLQTKRFLNPHLLTQIRTCCICNSNLANCFLRLEIERLMNPRQAPQSLKR